jgi:hypothetical protein
LLWIENGAMACDRNFVSAHRARLLKLPLAAESGDTLLIEHAIGGVKRYRMVKDKIRLLKDGIRETIMERCCGLHNFRLQYRLWNYAG